MCPTLGLNYSSLPKIHLNGFCILNETYTNFFINIDMNAILQCSVLS